jgi:isoamylase
MLGANTPPTTLPAQDRHLVERGLTNYWGYNTLAYFAPESRYVAQSIPQDAVQQFKIAGY